MNLAFTTLSILLAIATTNASTPSSNAKKHSTIERQLRQERIINGINAPVNRYPYTVSLQQGKEHFCGGSLIAPDLVLSAAHCGPISPETDIVLNPHLLNDPISNSESFNMDSFVTHPLYETVTGYDHDFMVIKLNAISNLPYVRLNTNATSPYDSQSMQVMGWGLTDPWGFDVSNTLQEVDVVSITNEACDSSSTDYNGMITFDSLCAAEINQGACQGDSGGPLVIAGANAGQDVQVGVVSWGIGCAEPEHPGVYARVEEEFDWIRFQVCRLSRDPPEYFGCGDGEVTFSPAPTSTPTAPTVSPSPTGPEIAVTVVLELDQFPMETSWTIKDGEGNIINEVLAGEYQDREVGATVSTVVVVPSDVELNFTLLDSYGDGFQGRVIVYLGEAVQNDKMIGYFDGLNSGFFSSVHEFAFTAGMDGILVNVFPTQVPSSPSAAPSGVPTAPTTSPAPTASSVSVLFEITTDYFPNETGWMVTLGDEVVHEVIPGSYELQYTVYSVVLPLADNGDYQLTLIDSYGDGQEGSMAVYLGDEAAEDKVLAYYDGNLDFFSDNFVMDFTVSEDAIVFLFPTAAPTTASPTPSPGPYAKCNVCGEGRSMSNTNAVWEFSTDLSLRCGNMEANGAQGLISQDYCTSLPALLGEVCGCEGDEKEQIVTTTAPPTLAPTPAPTPGLYPACSVCGEGMEVTLPEAEFGNSLHTCDELQTYGQVGAMAEGICQLYASIIQTDCGCAPVWD